MLKHFLSVAIATTLSAGAVFGAELEDPKLRKSVELRPDGAVKETAEKKTSQLWVGGGVGWPTCHPRPVCSPCGWGSGYGWNNWNGYGSVYGNYPTWGGGFASPGYYPQPIAQPRPMFNPRPRVRYDYYRPFGPYGSLNGDVNAYPISDQPRDLDRDFLDRDYYRTRSLRDRDREFQPRERDFRMPRDPYDYRRPERRLPESPYYR